MCKLKLNLNGKIANDKEILVSRRFIHKVGLYYDEELMDPSLFKKII